MGRKRKLCPGRKADVTGSAWERTFRTSAIYHDHFLRLVAREAASGATLRRAIGPPGLAAKGRVLEPAIRNPEPVAAALDPSWPEPVTLTPWTPPAGAFGDGAGPG